MYSKPTKVTQSRQARSQDLEKGGGYFERVRKVQTTLTRIFIVLESVSHDLSKNSDQISRKDRKFEGFFRPKSGGLQKIKIRSSPKLSPIFRPKSEGFFRPKSGGLQKTKKVFAEIEPDFSPKIRNSKVFSAQNQVVSKEKNKRSSPKLSLIFRPKSEIQTFEGGLFSYGGGLFSIFHQKSVSKALKTCDFAYFTSQWGGSSPPPAPPWLRY